MSNLILLATRSFFLRSTIAGVVEKPGVVSLGFMKLSSLDRLTFFRSAPLMHFIIISGLTIRLMTFLMILNKSLYKYGTMGSSVWYVIRNGCNNPAIKLKKLSFAGVKRSLTARSRFKNLFEFGVCDFGNFCQKLLILKMFGHISSYHSANCLSSTHRKNKGAVCFIFDTFC